MTFLACALAFALALGIAPAGAIELLVRPGYSSLVAPDRWNPVTVTVIADERERAGILRISTAPGPPASAGDARYTVVRAIALAAGERVTVTEVIPVGRTLLPLVVSFEDDDGTAVEVVQTLIPHPAGAPLAAVVGGRQLPLAGLTIAGVAPEELSPYPAGLDAIALLVLDEALATRVDAARLAAIVDWVDRGGVILWTGPLAALERDLAPLFDLPAPAGALFATAADARAVENAVARVAAHARAVHPVYDGVVPWDTAPYRALLDAALPGYASRWLVAAVLAAALAAMWIPLRSTQTPRFGVRLGAAALLVALLLWIAVRTLAAPPPAALAELQEHATPAATEEPLTVRRLVAVALDPRELEVEVPAGDVVVTTADGVTATRRVDGSLSVAIGLARWDRRRLTVAGRSAVDRLQTGIAEPTAVVRVPQEDLR